MDNAVYSYGMCLILRDVVGCKGFDSVRIHRHRHAKTSVHWSLHPPAASIHASSSIYFSSTVTTQAISFSILKIEDPTYHSNPYLPSPCLHTNSMIRRREAARFFALRLSPETVMLSAAVASSSTAKGAVSSGKYGDSGVVRIERESVPGD
jgi:hypothetical protein